MKKLCLNILIIGFVPALLLGCAANKPSEPSLDVNQQAGTMVAATLMSIYSATNAQILQDPTAEPPATPPAPSPTSDWKTFQYDAYGISFSYPPDWYGPDMHEDLEGIHFQIGSDVVYPFGTDRSERIYTKQDAYYLTIDYYENVENLSLEEYPVRQPWSQPLLHNYSSLLAMADGESLSDVRDLIIRKRAIAIGQFTGMEFIFTLSDTAETERYFSRQILAFDEARNLLHITGMPNNVDLSNPENWKDAYQAVDLAYEGIFTEVVNSIRIA
jgi:hypothetical protein